MGPLGHDYTLNYVTTTTAWLIDRMVYITLPNTRSGNLHYIYFLLGSARWAPSRHSLDSCHYDNTLGQMTFITLPNIQRDFRILIYYDIETFVLASLIQCARDHISSNYGKVNAREKPTTKI